MNWILGIINYVYVIMALYMGGWSLLFVFCFSPFLLQTHTIFMGEIICCLGFAFKISGKTHTHTQKGPRPRQLSKRILPTLQEHVITRLSKLFRVLKMYSRILSSQHPLRQMVSLVYMRSLSHRDGKNLPKMTQLEVM